MRSGSTDDDLRADPALVARHLRWWTERAPADQWLVWSIRQGKHSAAVQLGEARSDGWRTTATAIARAENPYVRTTLCHSRPSVPGRRGGSEYTGALVGVWADIDIAHADHAPTQGLPRPTDLAAALEVLQALPAPSWCTLTGGGLHCWWRLADPLLCLTGEDRAQAAHLARSWSRALVAAGADRGWLIDSTGDLARLLRPAGSVRSKAHGSCLVQAVETGSDHQAADLQAAADHLLTTSLNGQAERRGTTAEQVAAAAAPAVISDALKPWEVVRSLSLAQILRDDPAGHWQLHHRSCASSCCAMRSSDRWEVWSRPGADPAVNYSIKQDQRTGAILLWSGSIASACRVASGDAVDPWRLWCAVRGLDPRSHAQHLRRVARGTEPAAGLTETDRLVVLALSRGQSAQARRIVKQAA